MTNKLPPKSAIVLAWSELVGAGDPPWGEGPVDWGEPQCWACHYYAQKWPDGSLAAWNQARGLERCHIVPDSLGGSDDPSNFVLMCARCHEDSPDHANPDILFAWMRKQPKRVLGSWLPDQWNELGRLSRAAAQLALESELVTAARDYMENTSNHFGWVSDGTRDGLLQLIGQRLKPLGETAMLKENR